MALCFAVQGHAPTNVVAMSKVARVILLGLVVGLLGCVDNTDRAVKKGTAPDASTEDPDTVQRITVEYDSTFEQRIYGTVISEDARLGRLYSLTSVGDYLIAGDAAVPSAHVLRNDGTYLREVGDEGEGPGEYVGGWSFDVVSHDPPVFWLYDLSLLRMTRVDLSDQIASSDEKPIIIDFQIGFSPTSPTLVNDSLVVTPGFLLEPGRLAHLDASSGSLLRVVGPPFSNPDDVPVGVLQHAYQSAMTVHPDGRRAALAYRYTDRVEIIHLDGTLTHAMNGPVQQPPVFEVGRMQGQPVMATNETTLSAYTAVTSTADRIYALYVGRTRGEPGSDLANRIHVFDWDGNLLDVYRLDRWTGGVAIDPTGNTLYTTSTYPEPAVLRYSLDGNREAQ